MKWMAFLLLACGTVQIVAAQNVGIGTSFPSALLDVNGSFRWRGSSPATGSVLTSVDGSGNAIWDGTVAFMARGVNSASVTIPFNSNEDIVFNTEMYDIGGDYNITTGVFTAPVSGIYHFDAGFMWNNPGLNQGYVAITLFAGTSQQATSRAPAVSYSTISTTVSTTLRLSAGTTIKVAAFHAVASGVNESLLPNSQTAWFNGHLIRRTL